MEITALWSQKKRTFLLASSPTVTKGLDALKAELVSNNASTGVYRAQLKYSNNMNNINVSSYSQIFGFSIAVPFIKDNLEDTERYIDAIMTGFMKDFLSTDAFLTDMGDKLDSLDDNDELMLLFEADSLNEDAEVWDTLHLPVFDDFRLKTRLLPEFNPSFLTQNGNWLIDMYLMDLHIETISSDAPEELNGYYLNQSIQDLWFFFDSIQDAPQGTVQFAILTGGQGNGKTTFAEKIAEHLGWDIEAINCANVTSENGWWYEREIAVRDGASSTVYENHGLVNRLNENGDFVLLLDELNRIQKPNIVNALLSFLDDQKAYLSGEIDEETGHAYRMRRQFSGRVLVIGCQNEGSKYVGTGLTDPALLGRADVVVDMPNPDVTLMRKILKDRNPNLNGELVVNIASIINAFIIETEHKRNEYDVSIRDALNVARLCSLLPTVNNISLQKIVRYSVINKFSNGKLKATLNEHLTAKI